MDKTSSAIAANVLRFRLASGLTQNQLAERAGLSRPAVAKIESGYYASVSSSTIDKLATGLGVPAAVLVTPLK